MLALPAICSGCGPPKNSVTMTPLIVTVFMNSARKNSAKRMLRVLGVEAADELLLGLDEVERRAVQLGGGGDEEDDERHERRWRRRSTWEMLDWWRRCRWCSSVPDTRMHRGEAEARARPRS